MEGLPRTKYIRLNYRLLHAKSERLVASHQKVRHTESQQANLNLRMSVSYSGTCDSTEDDKYVFISSDTCGK